MKKNKYGLSRWLLCGLMAVLAMGMAACGDSEESETAARAEAAETSLVETEAVESEEVAEAEDSFEEEDYGAYMEYVGVWCAYGDQSDSRLEVYEDGSWVIESLKDGIGGGTWKGRADGIELTADDDMVVGTLRFEEYNKLYAYMNENYCGMFGNWFMPFYKSCDAESELYAERWGLGGDYYLDFESDGAWIAPIHGHKYNDDGDYAILPIEVEAYKFHDAIEDEMHELGFKVVISYPAESVPNMSGKVHYGFKNVFFDAYNGERIPISGLKGNSANISAAVEVQRDGKSYVIDLICDNQWEYPKNGDYKAIATYTVQASMPQDYEGLRFMLLPAAEDYDTMKYYEGQKFSKHEGIYDCYGDRIRESFVIVVN